MRIFARPSYERALKNLAPEQKAEIQIALGLLPEAFGKPHVHAGIGLRRVGKYFEFRAGLKLRVLFVIREADAVLLTAGNHDHVRAWIKENS